MTKQKLTLAASNGAARIKKAKKERIAVNGPIAPASPAKRRAPHGHGRRTTPAVVKPKQDRNLVKIDRKALLDKGFIDPDGGRSKLAEEFRLIKRPLLARAFGPESDRRDRVILVTSSKPGEGKTFSALNLAISLSRERDANVLLIDADQAVAGTTTALELERDPGLANLLSGSAVDPGRILRKTDISRLWFIPPGMPNLNLTELVASDRMSAILDTILLADPKRIIVIDAPPLLATSEAMALTMHAGQTVFVIEAGSTPRDNVEEALAMVAERTEIQILLNKAQNRRSRAAYYGSYYDSNGDDVESRQGFWRKVARMITGRPMSVSFLATVGLAAAPLALAAISVVPRIEAAIGYTDNVNYSTDNNGDFGAEIAPGVDISARTSRVLAEAEYTARQLLFLEEKSSNNLKHGLRAQARGEVIEDAFYLDLAGDIDQEFVDSRGPQGRPVFGLSSNEATRITRSISPFFRRDFGDFGELEVRYRFTRSSLNDNELADATSHSVGGVLKSAPNTGPLAWTASVLGDDTRFDNTKDRRAFDVESGLAALDGRYQFTNSWAALGGIGYSHLDDESLDDGGDDSIYWKAGFDYSPNPRYGLQATVGQVFAEPAVDVEGTWRVADGTELEATYSDGLQSRFRLLQDRLKERDLLRNERRTERSDLLEELETLLPEGDVQQVDDNTFRQRRAGLALNLAQGRNALRLDGFVEDRDFDVGADDRLVYGAGAVYRRQLTRRSDFSAAASWQRNEFDDDGRSDDDLNLTLSYGYEINPTTTFDAGYNFYQRLSNEQDEDILGNTVFVRVRKTF